MLPWFEAVSKRAQGLLPLRASATSPSAAETEAPAPATATDTPDPTLHQRSTRRRRQTRPARSHGASPSAPGPSMRSATGGHRGSSTSAVKRFLQTHDNCEADPIDVSSDDEEPPTKSPASAAARAQRGHPATHPPSGRRTRTETRDEGQLFGDDRIEGGLLSVPTRLSTKQPAKQRRSRDPDAVLIEDPMTRQKFSLKAGYAPLDTLNTSPASSRQTFLLGKTASVREKPPVYSSPPTKEFDRGYGTKGVRPIKRRRIGASPTEERSASNTAPLSEPQAADSSSDELRLSPPGSEKPSNSQPGNQQARPRLPAYQKPRPNASAVNGGLNPQQDAQSSRPASPGVGGDLVEDSAGRRKAEKDGLLRSSSVEQQPNPTEPDISPYFTHSNQYSSRLPVVRKSIHHQRLTQDSPDALHFQELLPAVSTLAPNPARGPQTQAEHSDGNLPNPGRQLQAGSGQAYRRQNDGNIRSFDLEDLVHPTLPGAQFYTVEVNRLRKSFSFNSQSNALSDEPIGDEWPIARINMMICGSDPCPVVQLRFAQTFGRVNTLWLRFKSRQGASEFIVLLQDLAIRLWVLEKAPVWVENAFSNGRAAMSNYLRKSAAPMGSNGYMGPDQPAGAVRGAVSFGARRPRAIDRLDAPTTSSVSTRNGAPVASGQETRGIYDEQMLPFTNKRLLTPENAISTRRTTRSQDVGRQERSLSPWVRKSAFQNIQEQWTSPLVYPKPGKRAATVEFEDLARLDEDQFLNDSLIGLFIRYLEVHMEEEKPEDFKKTHFFNSYLFDQLTKGSRGKRSISYESVAKWTKTINLFTRKFVIVPINENLHWYVAIICNLDTLLERKKGIVVQDDSEEEGAGDLPPAASAVSASLPQPARDDNESDHSTASGKQRAQTRKSLADLSIDDGIQKSEEVVQVESDVLPQVPKKTAGKKRPARRPLPKYNPKEPVIITLDSLGAARSATCSALKQYISAEGKDKQGLDVDPTEIKGMTAKGIPTQSNFSDCGLYLCMYLEQFAANPDAFVERILQRDEEGQQWPKRIRSEDLRSRLRDMTLELYRRQQGQASKMEIPPIGQILLTTAPAAENNESEPKTKEEIREARRRFEDLVNDDQSPNPAVDAQPSPTVATRVSPEAPGPVVDAADDADDADDDPVIVAESTKPNLTGLRLRRAGHFAVTGTHATRSTSTTATSPKPDISSVSAAPSDVVSHSTPCEPATAMDRKKRRLSDPAEQHLKKLKRLETTPDKAVELDKPAITQRHVEDEQLLSEKPRKESPEKAPGHLLERGSPVLGNPKQANEPNSTCTRYEKAPDEHFTIEIPQTQSQAEESPFEGFSETAESVALGGKDDEEMLLA